jgi:hypothetical protein
MRYQSYGERKSPAMVTKDKVDNRSGNIPAHFLILVFCLYLQRRTNTLKLDIEKEQLSEE